MAKRRTRAQKIKAKHTTFSLTVNRENKTAAKKVFTNVKHKKKTVVSAKKLNIEPQAQDMLKSLTLASLILGLEIVIYLFSRR